MDATVVISAIDQPGKIIEIIICGKNLYYKIEYWWQGEVKTVSLYESELREK